MLVAQIEAAGPALYFAHADHLGTPDKLTDATKAIVWDAALTPWGEVETQGGTVQVNIRLPGQYYDQETGLHYNWHRDYDPTTGRYMQSDPIGLKGGLNRYAYVSAKPTLWIDPTGQNTAVKEFLKYSLPVAATACAAIYEQSRKWLNEQFSEKAPDEAAPKRPSEDADAGPWEIPQEVIDKIPSEWGEASDLSP